MKQANPKYNLSVTNGSLFRPSPERYELSKGTEADAPSFSFGSRYQWIGFDKEEIPYVRMTKSVFRLLMADINTETVAAHEADIAQFK